MKSSNLKNLGPPNKSKGPSGQDNGSGNPKLKQNQIYKNSQFGNSFKFQIFKNFPGNAIPNHNLNK